MKLTKTPYFINIDKSAASSRVLAGKRLAVLSDLHDSDHGPVLDILRSDIPDAIMIPGDVVHGYFPDGNDYVIDKSRNVMTVLEGCRDIAPTYMSVGNHESLFCSADYDRLRATGVTLLDNEWTELRFRNSQSYDEAAADPAVRVCVGGLTSGHTLNYNRFRDEYNRRNGAEEGSERYERYPYRRRPKDLEDTPPESAWLDDFEQEVGYKVLLSNYQDTITVKFHSAAFKAGMKITVFHLADGQTQFEKITPDSVTDGECIVTFTSLSPVIFATEGTSDKTGETAPILPIAAAICLAGIVFFGTKVRFAK